jgi:hypothetical protein
MKQAVKIIIIMLAAYFLGAYTRHVYENIDGGLGLLVGIVAGILLMILSYLILWGRKI